jgi:hypothetical protein
MKRGTHGKYRQDVGKQESCNDVRRQHRAGGARDETGQNVEKSGETNIEI